MTQQYYLQDKQKLAVIELVTVFNIDIMEYGRCY
jgi:hypothetical protein